MKAIVCDFCGKYERGISARRVKVGYYDFSEHREVDIKDLCSVCFVYLMEFCKDQRAQGEG